MRFPASSPQKSPARLTRKTATPRRAWPRRACIAGRASQCVASQCVASQINSLSRQKHSGRNKPRLSRLLRKSRRSADRFHRNAVLPPPIGSSSELQPRRQKGRAARENKGRRSPIRRENRMQSFRKRLLDDSPPSFFFAAPHLSRLHTGISARRPEQPGKKTAAKRPLRRTPHEPPYGPVRRIGSSGSFGGGAEIRQRTVAEICRRRKCFLKSDTFSTPFGHEIFTPRKLFPLLDSCKVP